MIYVSLQLEGYEGGLVRHHCPLPIAKSDRGPKKIFLGRVERERKRNKSDKLYRDSLSSD